MTEPPNPDTDQPVAVVACLDSRMDVLQILGLDDGEAHVIRNAGGAITDDVIRSLSLAQRFLGTRGVVVLHHSDCGLAGVRGAASRKEPADGTRTSPEASSDAEEHVRQSMRRLRAEPSIQHEQRVRGFVYDVETGRLREVTA